MLMLSHSASTEPEDRAASDASTVRMLSRHASSEPEQREELAPIDPDVAQTLLLLRLYSLQLHPQRGVTRAE